MSTTIRKTLLAASSALVGILASAYPAAAQSYNLQMHNNSGYEIYQVRFSSVMATDFPDLLGHYRTFPDGTQFTITQISPGFYDIEFIDEDSDVCVLHNVPVYQNLNWDLSRSWLLSCEQ